MTRIPQDAAHLVKTELAARAAVDHPELSVVLEVPSGWRFGDGPLLVIADDGGPVAWPVSTSPTIRVTSWTSGRDRTFVHWAMGQLLARRFPRLAGVQPGTGVIEARDKATRADLASFTVLTRVRTISAP